MKTLFNPKVRAELMARVEKLTPETQALWGQMCCGEMLTHLAEGMRIGLGELPTRPKRTWIRRWPLNKLVLYFMPWPKGAPSPKEIRMVGKPYDWEASRTALLQSFDLVAARDPKGAWPDHPIFGRMKGRDWGFLGWRHVDHHLRQFGV